MSIKLRLLALATALALGGCVVIPTGPSVAALPGTGRSFDEFRFDEGTCKQYAQEQTGAPAQAQADTAVASAVVGTAIGALAGAAISGSSGAAVGAGVGLLGGSIAGSNAAYASGYETQRRYDIAYQQCMYAKGHRVPASGRVARSAPPVYNAPPPPPAYNTPPPPPPGTPPPPPRSW